MPGIIAERVFTLFDKNKDGYSGKEEFIATACRLLSQKFEDNIKAVFEIYDFDDDGVISREDIRVLLSYVPLAEILADKKNQGRKEGAFTKSGGG
jgi:Ca2+-binding EF-hand superfamily protein